jgi:hypothetical protein
MAPAPGAGNNNKLIACLLIRLLLGCALLQSTLLARHPACVQRPNAQRPTPRPQTQDPRPKTRDPRPTLIWLGVELVGNRKETFQGRVSATATAAVTACGLWLGNVAVTAPVTAGLNCGYGLRATAIATAIVLSIQSHIAVAASCLCVFWKERTCNSMSC